MHLGELSGWTSVALGQLVSWPQVLKLRRERGDGVSLASYAIVLVSMSLFLVHAVAIGDTISMVSVPLSLIPNVMIAATLARRRLTRAAPKAVATGTLAGADPRHRSRETQPPALSGPRNTNPSTSGAVRTAAATSRSAG